MAARLAPAETITPEPADAASPFALDALWLRALQRVARRSAHELKGVLNGVSVNLEVVRSRSEKPDAAASAVSKFATAAAAQFEEVLGMSDALLALARPAESPVDVGSTVSRIGKLLVPAAHADGRRIEMSGGIDVLGATAAPSAAARLAVAECLLAATDASTHVVCRGTPATLRIESEDGSTFTPPADDVLAVLRDAGISVQTESSVITISFPRPSGKAATV